MELKFNCPDAIHVPRKGKPDRKKKFSVNVEKNVGRCWTCDYRTGNAQQFVEEYGVSVSAGVEWGTLRTAAGPRKPVKLPPEYSLDYTNRSLFGAAALNYLLKRGLSRELIGAYEIGYCPTGSHHHRIIIPIYQNGTLVNFQGRDWTGAQEPKYLGPLEQHGKPDPDVMFNFDRAAKTGVIVLVEGTFDALRIPEYGVAILGKGWTPAKRAAVLRAKLTAVYICLDDDARDEDQKIHEDLAGVVPYVETIPLAAHDLGDAPAKEVGSIRRLCYATHVAARAFAGVSQPARRPASV